MYGAGDVQNIACPIHVALFSHLCEYRSKAKQYIALITSRASQTVGAKVSSRRAQKLSKIQAHLDENIAPTVAKVVALRLRRKPDWWAASLPAKQCWSVDK